MEKIWEALERAEKETGEAPGSIKVVIYKDGSGRLTKGHSWEEIGGHFCARSSAQKIAAAINNYTELKKPKPRPIPEIVKDLSLYFQDRIISDTLGKLLDELQNSPAATFPF